jgi:hypothetical protein
MDPVYEKMRRLDARGPASRGVVVDAEGAMLGPDCILVRRTAAGYRCVRAEEAAAIQKVLFGAQREDPDHLFVLSQGIAKALNEGELALAQIYGLRIPVAGLDSGQLRKLTAVAPMIKANFNPDQPRIPAGGPGGGEWTDNDGGGGNDTVPLAAPVGATAAAAEAATSIFGPLGRTAMAGLSDLAAGMAAPTAFLGVLFLPTNRSLVTEGTLPAAPISPTATIGIRGFSTSTVRTTPRGSAWRQATSASMACSTMLPVGSSGAVSAAASSSTLTRCRLPPEEPEPRRVPKLQANRISRGSARTRAPKTSRGVPSARSPTRSR